MYKSSPAFSIKGKYNQSKHEIKPSPITYNLQNWNPKKTPSWKIGKTRNVNIKLIKTLVLGIMKLNLQKQLLFHYKRSNKFGIIGKQNIRTKINTQKSPSPAQYSPKQLQKGQSISFAKKYVVKNEKQYFPGPGSYERNLTIKTQSSLIGKQKRFVQQQQLKFIPGPGTYQYNRPSSAKLSFGKQKRQCKSKLSTSNLPGPGQYDNKSLFDQCSKHQKGFSLKTRISIKNLQIKPGPGNYQPDFKKVCSTNPSFSISKKHNYSTPAQNPAPNTYNIKSFNNSVHISFNKSKRKSFVNNKGIPGPGQYQNQKILIKFKSSPKFSLGLSRKNDVKQDFPGPGCYEPNKNTVKIRPKSAKIGTSMRCTEKRQTSPGPGQYNIDEKLQRSSSPSFIFGKDSRMKQRITTSPGPFQYLINSTVANVPSYAIK